VYSTHEIQTEHKCSEQGRHLQQRLADGAEGAVAEVAQEVDVLIVDNVQIIVVEHRAAADALHKSGLLVASKP
jgi:hypothetical protein